MVYLSVDEKAATLVANKVLEMVLVTVDARDA